MVSNSRMELMQEVNPVFLTARASLCVLEQVNDEDAVKLNSKLKCTMPEAPGLDKLSPQKQAMFKKLAVAILSMFEARYKATNDYFFKEGEGSFFDLACGLVPRSLLFARKGQKYIGADLPAVMASLRYAAEGCLEAGKENVSFAEVDATNYDTLEKAAAATDGELFISTEGLFPYLTEDEVKEVCANIRRLLCEHGGVWVCTDFEVERWSRRICSAYLSNMISDPREYMQLSEGELSDVKFAANSLCKGSRDSIKSALDGFGFDVQLVPMYDYLGDDAVLSLPEDRREAARDVYKDISFWVMTPKGGAESFNTSGKDFSAELTRRSTLLTVNLTGRLDTVTAPDLLKLYRSAVREGGIRRININMRKLDYISSAGLRVLMIMYKELPSNGTVNVYNANDSIREIFKTTGFSGLFNY